MTCRVVGPIDGADELTNGHVGNEYSPLLKVLGNEQRRGKKAKPRSSKAKRDSKKTRRKKKGPRKSSQATPRCQGMAVVGPAGVLMGRAAGPGTR